MCISAELMADNEEFVILAGTDMKGLAVVAQNQHKVGSQLEDCIFKAYMDGLLDADCLRHAGVACSICKEAQDNPAIFSTLPPSMRLLVTVKKTLDEIRSGGGRIAVSLLNGGRVSVLPPPDIMAFCL